MLGRLIRAHEHPQARHLHRAAPEQHAFVAGQRLRIIQDFPGGDLGRPIHDESHGAEVVVVQQQNDRPGENLAADGIGRHQKLPGSRPLFRVCRRGGKPGKRDKCCDPVHGASSIGPGSRPGVIVAGICR
jgi:hypothetical protein